MKRNLLFAVVILVMTWGCQEKDPKVNVITFEKEMVCLLPGDNIRVYAVSEPDYIKSETLEWSSQNTDICTVEAGVITAHAPGRTTVEISYGEVSSRCEVWVLTDTASGIVDHGPQINMGLSVNWGSSNLRARLVVDPGDDLKDQNELAPFGEYWRLATEEEWAELLNPDNCDWRAVTLRNQPGIAVFSKKTGYEDVGIFLPQFENSYYSCLSGVHVDFSGSEPVFKHDIPAASSGQLIRLVTEYDSLDVPMD